MKDSNRSPRQVELPSLCWPQHWQWMNEFAKDSTGRRPAVFTFTPRIEGGLSLRRFTDCLRRLTELHEALRTVYTTDAEARPRQSVLEDCEPRVFSDATEGSFDAAVQRARRTPNIVDGPIVTAAVATDGVVVDALIVVPQITVDGTSLAQLRSQFTEMLAGGEPNATRRDRVLGPSAVARGQSEARTRRLDERAREYWSSMFARAPHSSLPFYWAPRDPGDESTVTWFHSTDLSGKIRSVADRWNTAPSSVYLAAVSLLVSLWTGHESVVLASATSNRWSDAMRSSVGRYATIPYLRIDLDGDPAFSTMLKRAQSAALRAQRYGYYDVGELRMESTRRSVDRGSMIVAAVLFNFHDYESPFAPPAEGKDGVPAVDQHVDPKGTRGLDFDVYLSGGWTTIRMRAPESLLNRESARAFLTAVDRMLDAVVACDDPKRSRLAGLVNLPTYWNGPRWVRDNESWVNLDDISELVLATGEIEAVGTFVEGPQSDQAGTVVSYVACGDRPNSPDLVRDRLRALVSPYPTARVPDRIEFVDAVPSDVQDVSEWQRMPRPTPASGGASPRWNPDAEQALATAFAAVHQGRQWRRTDSFAEARGEFLLVPAFVDRLAALGWAGVRPHHLYGLAPLRVLAEQCRSIAE